MKKTFFSLWMFTQLTGSSSKGNNLRWQKRRLTGAKDEEFQRRLAESAAERFAFWTPEKVKSATPLDFKLDAVSGETYISGGGGNLVSYEDRNENGLESNGLYRDSIVPLKKLIKNSQSSSASQSVKGRTRRSNIISKEQMDDSNMISLLDNDTDKDDVLQALDTDRVLSRYQKDNPKPKGKEKDTETTNQPKIQWNRKTPKLRQLMPSSGSTVEDRTTFRAKVLPAASEIAAVYLQLTDFDGQTSNYISLIPTSTKRDEKMWEISLDGFVKEYAGTEWSYKIIVEESSGVQYSFVDIPFTVADARNFQFSPAIATSPEKNSVAREDIIFDAEWLHGGAIQTSTGRILFDFGGDTHVCSGTVVNDGGVYNERSLILTAAHCAYDDASKQFASNAIFVPDQAGSLAPTDFDCKNDKYGCWYLSFAVVEKGWTDHSFPENAEYDYAFFVVHDYVGTHVDGYTPVTGTLDQDVIPANLDFSADPWGRFFLSFGYSEDYDPGFRYCAGGVKTIREVPNYTNLWLPQCNLQGGASGGPWMVDLDSSGVGTVLSLNSWGFTEGPGMAGPSLNTLSGSKAECLFNVARTAQDPGSTRGYSVACH